MMSRRSLSVHVRDGRLLCALLACALSACSTTREGPSVSDTTTNWLHACKRNTDCRGESSCVAGTCTIECSPQAESACSSLATDAQCVESDQAPAHCDLPCRFDRACDSLGDDYACKEGACRPQSEITFEEKERAPASQLDAGMDAYVPVPVPGPVVDPSFDARVDVLVYDAGVDGATDSGYYFVHTDGEAGVYCPFAYPAVAWQAPVWEPFATDAGRDDRFKIVQETMVGRWHGLASPSWPKPFLVDLEFKADGLYSSRCSELIEPCCRVFPGSDEDNDLKQYRLLDALASGYVIGEIDLTYKIGDGGFQSSEIPGKLSYIERDQSGNGLRLHYRNGDESGLIRFDLRRATPP